MVAPARNVLTVMFLIFQFGCFIASFIYGHSNGVSVHVVVVFTVNHRVVFSYCVIHCYCLKKMLEFFFCVYISAKCICLRQDVREMKLIEWHLPSQQPVAEDDNINRQSVWHVLLNA